MFSPYYPYHSVKKHPVRDGLGHLFTRIISILYQLIPVLIILKLCNVVDIPMAVLVLAWIGYQVIEFITELIDNAVTKYDQKKMREECHKYWSDRDEAISEDEYEDDDPTNGRR